MLVEGYPISPDLAALVPGHSIGRMLSSVEARELVKLLKYGPQKLVANSKTEPGTMSSHVERKLLDADTVGIRARKSSITYRLAN